MTAVARCAILPFALCALVGCSTPETTAVRLTVSYEPAWELEELGVTAGERAERTEPRRELRVLLPDDMAGSAVTIEVDGLRGGARLAHGAVEVVPALHGEVDAHVALARLPCGAWCSPGERECRADAVVTCEAGEDGCPAWSAAAPCGGDTPYCSLGVCAADCIDECAAGETRCDGPGQVRVCGHDDGDECLEWLAPASCADGETCSNGMCAGTCTDECTAGAVMCAGDGTRACGDLNADGCTEWGPAQACPAGQTCSGGACSAACTDDCSADTCEGLVHRACGQYDADACLDLSPGTSCVPADACSEGACDAAMGCSSAPKVCDAPPDPVCIDDGTLQVHGEAGMCTGATCSYPVTELACPGGCSGAACDPGWYAQPDDDAAPSPRNGHAAVWTGTEMIVWGGQGKCVDSAGACWLGNGGRFDPRTGAWSALPTAGAPAPREEHTAVWTGTEMIVWGGRSKCPGTEGACWLATGGRFDPSTGAWSALPTAGAPAPREGHAAVWTGTEMLVWGGTGKCPDSDSTCWLGSGGRFDPSTGSWSGLPTAGAPTPRADHAAVWTGTEMIVWSGMGKCADSDSTCWLGSGGRFDPGTGAWSALPVTAAPTPRDRHTAVWTGAEMIVWSGRGKCAGSDSTCWLGSGGRFRPSTGSWSALPTAGAPTPREDHAAVWTGAEMIVWSGTGTCPGADSTCWLAGGGRFVP